ncbi:hypothetical protein MWN52_13530 [Pseudoxanthomonas winnipegensis]|uniref:hypothetical protein n=1 Tax=Pseudoxanthomonas winnipegensis TaxID=2480810 RepID=UPI002578696B|nr:hypothetical protein [Pseudoxanthomonas winnipegensis]WJI14641.1 hypothetical protein MWN52_13530 [Pseudoxanthomonas winnipegensis]
MPAKWHGSNIKPGDILLARFPFREAPDRPAPQYHPVLVLAKNGRIDPWQLFVAYGTSSDLALKNAWQFIIPPAGNHASAKRANRQRDTKFDLGRTALLNFNQAWFSCAEDHIYPRIGELDRAGMAVYESARRAYESHKGSSLIPGKPMLDMPSVAAPQGSAPSHELPPGPDSAS